MTNEEVPDIIISRLPIYLRALKFLQINGKLTASSNELGELIGVSSAQIRKDLSHFGEFGKQGTGYNIPFLVEKLSTILHVDRTWEMAVIGMGDMGHAVTRTQGFKGRGFRVAMLFDADPAKVGKVVEGLVIQDERRMVSLIQQAGIRIAVLCVPVDAAQAVTDELVKAGIQSILAYSTVRVVVPAGVRVVYVDPSASLQRMTYYME